LRLNFNNKPMKITKTRIIAVLMGCFIVPQVAMSKDKFELVKFTTEDGGSIQGAYFKANSPKAVIFAHGAIFNKESWYFLAEKFQQENITALAIDFGGYGKSKAGSSGKKMYDILGAISYLHGQGYDDINIIGGSMGGAAVLSALTLVKKPVNKVVLLAPAGGPAIKSAKTDKLFVISKDEGLYDRVTTIYLESAEPKKIKEYAGSAHAQHMFKEGYANELVTIIMDFISGSQGQ
jgi:alpha-beta hydrolase superfamily lysophospholipase